jgi:uncharacterized protein (DUF1330 family)
MMSAFVVIHATITDAEKFKAYGAGSGPTVEAHGGELVTGGHLKSVLCGEMKYDRCVILKFPDVEAAESWYNSPEYQALIPNRDESVGSTFFIVA